MSRLRSLALAAARASEAGSVALATVEGPVSRSSALAGPAQARGVSNVVAPSWVRPHPALQAAEAAGPSQADVARTVTETIMFPWERRQLGDGTQSKGLRTWEKWYWGIFAGAVGVFLFNRIGGPAEEAEPDWELLRRRRHEAARILIGGPANFAIGDDPFAGMTPREVGRFLASERRRLGMTRGAEGEAFEGLSQSEIEARIEGEVDERDPRHPRWAGMTAEEVRAIKDAQKPKSLVRRVREFLGLRKAKSATDSAPKPASGDGAAAGAGGDGGEGGGEGRGGGDEGKSDRGSEGVDEWEGLSPEEIDAKAKQGGASGAGVGVKG